MILKRLISIILTFSLIEGIASAQELQPQLNGAVTNYKEDIVDRDNYIKVSLIDVVLETVSQSNNVKAAREKVIQSNIKLNDAYAGYLPSIDGTYKSARTETKPGDDEKETNIMVMKATNYLSHKIFMRVGQLIRKLKV